MSRGQKRTCHRPVTQKTLWRCSSAPHLLRGSGRTEHVTRAAQEMGVPQSTLSRAMVRLEQDLGVELFARRGRTVSLTSAGRTFLGSVERALAEIERAADEVRADADPATGKVASASCTPWARRRSRTHPRLPRRPPPRPLQPRPDLRRGDAGTAALRRAGPVPHLAGAGRARPGGPPPRRAEAPARRPRRPPPRRPQTHPPRRGRRRDLRDPRTGLRPAPHHRRGLPGGGLQAEGRLRGEEAETLRVSSPPASEWPCSRHRPSPARELSS